MHLFMKFCFIKLFADMRCTLRKLEHENADLKFLNNQYVAKIRCLEKDSKQKSECILKLQEKNLHAVVQTPGTVQLFLGNLQKDALV